MVGTSSTWLRSSCVKLELKPLGARSLPVLPVIENHRICRVEGYNGIGKTLSVRLLELCTGGQPYLRQQLAWDALKAGLGEMEITVSELTAGAESIRWRFDTRAWGGPEEPKDDWFDIAVDGDRSELSDVRKLLSVHRIAGNEGLIGTLAGQIRRDAELVRRWQGRVEAGEQYALPRVLQRVGDARKLLSLLDETLYRELTRQRSETSKTADSVREELQGAERRLEALEKAATLHGRVAELEAVGEDISTELVELDSKLAAADKAVEEIRTRLNEVERRVEQSAAVREQLAKARQLRTSRLGRLENATRDVARLLQRGGVAQPEDAPARAGEVRAELERLVVRRSAVDAGPRMRSLLSDLGSRLTRAEKEGLGTQELVASSGVSMSVADAREAFATRAAALSRTDETDAGAALSRRISETTQQLRALESIAEQVSKARRARQLLEEADEEIRKLVEGADERAGDDADQLRKAQREAEDDARRIAGTRGALRRRQDMLTGGRSIDELARERDELLLAASSTPEGLAEDVASARSQLAELRVRKEEAELQERDAAARAVQQERRLNDVVAGLAHSDEFGWIRYALPQSIPTGREAPDRQLELVSDLRQRIERVAARASDFGRQIGGVAQSLDDLADQIRDGQAGTDQKGYLPALRASLGDRYSDYFDEPEVRSALLPAATEAAINFETMTVDWKELDGDGGSRPLEAFSSGQQAFAYTRATLAGLDLNPAASALNRLIALDEFGAFVARDRIEDLIGMLRSHRDRHEADQVLVILPVAENYEAQLAANPPKHLKPRLERINRELRDRRYFTEEFAL